MKKQYTITTTLSTGQVITGHLTRKKNSIQTAKATYKSIPSAHVVVTCPKGHKVIELGGWGSTR